MLFFIYCKEKAVFPKGRKSWVAKPILEDKDYMYLHYMMEDILQLRLIKHRQELFDYEKPDFKCLGGQLKNDHHVILAVASIFLSSEAITLRSVVVPWRSYYNSSP